MDRLGYQFKDDKILNIALTHSSYANENHCECNERLEFLGDSVLSIIVSEYLFLNMPTENEGNLSKIRASLVCEQSLAMLSRILKIGENIKLGRGEELSGGRDRASILSDAFEAVLAAIFLDGGIDAAKRWVLDIMKEDLALAVSGKIYRDYKTILQEVIQKDGGRVTYRTVSETGPDHKKDFLVEVLINDKKAASAVGASKKDAEQNAAKKVLADMHYEIL